MLSLVTIDAGFLMRPLGAVVLGAYADRRGRRDGLILTLGLMSLGIFLVACMPGYVTIGIVAPIFILAGRLLQGFSAGMELGGVSVQLSEISTAGHTPDRLIYRCTDSTACETASSEVFGTPWKTTLTDKSLSGGIQELAECVCRG